MLGQPMSMLIPQVIGFKLTGELHEGATATDLVLTVTEMLRQHGVVGKFVEFYGAGPGQPAAGRPGDDRQHVARVRLDLRDLPDRRGDAALPRVLRPAARADRARRGVRQGAGALARRGLRGADVHRTLELDLGDVVPSIAGPEAPAGPRVADRVQAAPSGWRSRASCPTTSERGRGASRRASRPATPSPPTHANGDRSRARAAAPAARRSPTAADARSGHAGRRHRDRARPRPRGDRRDHQLHQHLEPVGDARRRAARAQRRAEGAEGQAVGQDVAGAGLEGGDRVPGPRGADRVRSKRSASTSSATAAPPASATAARCRRRSPTSSDAEDLAVVSVLERQPQLRGPDQPRREDELPGLAAAVRRLRARRDDGHRPLRRAARRGRARRAGVPEGHLALGSRGRARRSRRRFSRTCSARATARCSTATSAGTRSRSRRATGSRGTRTRPTCASRRSSRTCPREPEPVTDIEGARVLAVLGDSVTTDHISPAGSIKRDSPAGQYLIEHGVEPKDFNSYGSRRGNHEVMMRGTFANIRLRNQLAPGTEGGVTLYLPDGERDADLRRGDALRSRRTRRSSCSPARSTVRAHRATGRPRARGCWACAR